MRYAIVTGGAVTNVIVLRETNAGDFPGAVALHDRPVGIGDTYSESKFWRDGEELLTSDEEIAAMQTAAVAVLRFVVADNDRLAAGALYPKWAEGQHAAGGTLHRPRAGVGMHSGLRQCRVSGYRAGRHGVGHIPPPAARHKPRHGKTVGAADWSA